MARIRTIDWYADVVATRDKSAFLADAIGKRMYRTPEGYLVCEGVPIARVGDQIYGRNETPIEPGEDGRVVISRDADQVFRPETIRSFEGKDVVDDHPDQDVNPKNWRQLSVGHAQNVRRGEGVEDDLLLADLLIKDALAIDAILSGKREVSCGYDAEYERTGPGRGRQHTIVGNHIALVERGRCGPRCSIRDHEVQPQEAHMAKQTIRDAVMKALGVSSTKALARALKVRDAEELEEALGTEVEAAPEGRDAEPGNEGGDHTHIHVHMPGGEGEPIVPDAEGGAAGGEEGQPEYFKAHVAQNNARFDRLEAAVEKLISMVGGEEEGEGEGAAGAGAGEGEGEGELEKDAAEEFGEEAPPGTTDSAIKKARDSALLADAFQATVATAEVLSPGISVPAFDAKAKPKATLDAIVGLRRRALDAVYQTEEGKGAITAMIGGRAFDVAKMKARDVRATFNAVGVAVKMARSTSGGGAAASATRDRTPGTFAALGGEIKSPADLNKKYAKLYGEGATA